MDREHNRSVQVCPKCLFRQTAAFEECPQCGVVVWKFQPPSQEADAIEDPIFQVEKPRQERPRRDGWGWLQRVLDPPRRQTGPLGFLARATLWLVLLIWGGLLILSPVSSNAVGESFLHLINLPFHEAGHLIFSPFGRFIASVGGTLGQLLVPLACGVTFLLKNRDNFAAAVSLWWLGENFLDIAPYINDARAGTLPLLGGNTGQTAPYGFHDWQFILGELDLLEYDHTLAGLAGIMGSSIMLLSLVWSGFLLYRIYVDRSFSVTTSQIR